MAWERLGEVLGRLEVSRRRVGVRIAFGLGILVRLVGLCLEPKKVANMRLQLGSQNGAKIKKIKAKKRSKF